MHQQTLHMRLEYPDKSSLWGSAGNNGVKYLTDAFAYSHKAMNALTDKNQLDMVKAPFPGAPDMARAGIANIAISHTFDHYGQMVVYARMNNVIPPASR